MSERLIHLMPKYYANSRIAKGIFAAVENESDLFVEAGRDVIRQANPLLATWGLDLWEKQLGVDTIPGMSQGARRARILPKLNPPPLITPSEMARMAAEFTVSKRATVVEFGREKRFEVWIGANDFLDHGAMHQAVYDIRPKHLAFKIVAQVPTVNLEVTGTVYAFEVEYLICGTFYPEDAEGRMVTVGVATSDSGYTGSVGYQRCGDFYVEEG